MQQTQISSNLTVEPESLPLEPSEQAVAISFVVPVMNEQQSIAILYEKLSAQLDSLGKSYEVIFVDDGSTDGTFKELEKLHNAYDLVSGWKFPRLDPITKTFPSRVFNGLVSTLTGVHLHDINNGFKAYRREVIEDTHFKLYGDFHRFVPVMAHWRGFRITEIKVRHYPRQFGVSKFGARRFGRGLVDLLNVLFLTSFLRTPLRLFGPLGFWIFFLGVLVDGFVVARRVFFGQLIRDQPLLFVGIILMIFGVQFILTGLQSEMIRHYAFQPGEEYSIRQELD